MHREKKDKHFVKKPIYPGGLKAMRELIAKEMKYPEEAKQNKIEGTVFVKYDIDYKGNVVSSKVISGLGYGCDEEAQRLVSLFKFKVPKGPRRMKVKFHKSIRIKFKTPKRQSKKSAPSKAIRTPTQIRYSIVQQQSPKKEDKGGYTYTITY